jgi:hypothetical protein
MFLFVTYAISFLNALSEQFTRRSKSLTLLQRLRFAVTISREISRSFVRRCATPGNVRLRQSSFSSKIQKLGFIPTMAVCSE